MNPPRSVLIEAALTGDFHDVVVRYCDGKWDRLPELWDVPFEELVEEAGRRGLEGFVVVSPPGEGYWLRRTEEGFETFYVERGVYSDVVVFPELEAAFRHWLRCHLVTHRLDVGDSPSHGSLEPPGFSRGESSEWWAKMICLEKEVLSRLVRILGLTALVIAPALLLYAHLVQSSLRTFQQHGVAARATVIDKGRTYNPSPDYHVKVSFWTAPLLEGGELILAEISQVRPADWRAIQAGDEVEVVYLADDPERVVLRTSLSVPNRALAERYEFGIAVLVLGGLLVAVTMRGREQFKEKAQ